MNLYIDESGPFVVPEKRKNRVSCVAALVLPEATEDALFNEFAKMRVSWGAGDEVKGSQLDETQMAATLEMLASADAFADVLGIDMGLHRVEALTHHRDVQADGYVANLTSAHNSQLVRELHSIRAKWRQLSYQLSVQATLTFLLIESVFQQATLYFVLRRPGELGQFRWVVDAKNHERTSCEELWLGLLKPILFTRGLSKPHVSIKGADYGAFQKFRVLYSSASDEERAVMEWMAQQGSSTNLEETAAFVDFRKVFADLSLADSASNAGLQLADIVASAFSRACNQTLQEAAWSPLRQLLILRNDSPTRLIGLSPDGPGTSTTTGHNAHVLQLLTNGAKSLWPEESGA